MVLTTTQQSDSQSDGHRFAQPRPTIESLLAEQRVMSPVERLSTRLERGETFEDARFSRELLPLSTPAADEQYAFEVDLDACSGCKACVSACHHMNGLEETETWRWVGQLHGSDAGNIRALPVLQHVTTACHHCLDPGCLAGCPTNAYEKDPDTGIVRHLDDQCFGCQYCTMACPYEVPQYSSSKGIVRKCDMCADRLSAGEAPACVDACPNEAIRITVVRSEVIRAQSDAGDFLPGTPDPSITLPTTLYRRDVRLPASVRPADSDFVRPQHAHLPLVGTLTLTQMGIGALAVVTLLRWLDWVDSPLSLATGTGISAATFGLGLILAPLHLGRPQYFFRSLLGWRHSWLSREAILFGVALPLMILAFLLALQPLPEVLTPLQNESLRFIVELTGLLIGVAGVYCSVRIYQFCRRDYWLGCRTGLKFALTTATLGCASAAFTLAATGDFARSSTTACLQVVWLCLAIAASAQLFYDLSIFAHTMDAYGTLRDTARLLRNDLRWITSVRIISSAIGGIALPIALSLLSFTTDLSPSAITALTGSSLLTCLLGELSGRYLFFAAVIPLRMPGGVG